MSIPAAIRPTGSIIETVIAKGDLSKLTPDERNQYYLETCRSIGLNPLTRPFEYITLGGRLVLYARRDAADQLRKINGISVEIVSQDISDGLVSVHVRAKDANGRSDEDVGVVPISDQVRGEARANLILKAVTKAKRRVTLSISGLGFLDETEVASIPEARTASPPERVPAPIPQIPPGTPHKITMMQGATADEWASAYIKAIGQAKTVEELTEWENLNDAYLQRLSDSYHGVYEQVCAAVERRIEQVTPKPKLPAGMPDPKKDAQAAINWVAQQLLEAKTYEAAEAFWNQVVAPQETSFDHLDFGLLMAEWKRAEARLSVPQDEPRDD